MRCFSLYRRGHIYYCQFFNPRVGRTSSKEQYAFLYDTAVLELLAGV